MRKFWIIWVEINKNHQTNNTNIILIFDLSPRERPMLWIKTNKIKIRPRIEFRRISTSTCSTSTKMIGYIGTESEDIIEIELTLIKGTMNTNYLPALKVKGDNL